MKLKQVPFLKSLGFILLIFTLLLFQFCQTSRSASKSSKNEKMESTLSYHENIKPIMLQKCTPCHFPDRGRKKMLDTYEATRKNIEDILYRVQLPSSHEDFMPFKSKRVPLTTAEISLLKNWLDQGMPE